MILNKFILGWRHRLSVAPMHLTALSFCIITPTVLVSNRSSSASLTYETLSSLFSLWLSIQHFCLQAVAKKLHKVDVDVKLLRSSQGSSGHGEFLIQEKNKAKTHQDTTADDVDLIFSSNGLSFPPVNGKKEKIYILYLQWLNLFRVYLTFRTENIVPTFLPGFPISRFIRSKLVHQASRRFSQEDPARQHRSIRLQDHRYFAHGKTHFFLFFYVQVHKEIKFFLKKRILTKREIGSTIDKHLLILS